MALVNRRVSVNTFIGENINDAFNDVKLVADNIADIVTVADQINGAGLDPLVYTKEAADAKFALISNTYTTSAADSKFATVLNFQSTGIDDNATSTAITIDANEHIYLKGATPFTSWPTNYNAIHLATNMHIATFSSHMYLTSQCVYDGSNWRLTGSGYAVKMDLYNGTFAIDVTTSSGNSGDIPTFTTLISATIGAGIVTIPNLYFTDPSANFVATSVDDAIAEIRDDLLSTSNGFGASTVAIEDSAANFTGTNVETALTELSDAIGQNYLYQTQSIGGSYSILTSDFGKLIEHFTAGTLTLPNANTVPGLAITIRNANNGLTTIATTASQIIDDVGATSIVLGGRDWVTLVSYSTGWMSFRGSDSGGKFRKGGDITHSGPATLQLTDEGSYFDVGGAGNITAISARGGGHLIKLHFDTASTQLNYHSTNLILPGGASFTPAIGDEAEFFEYSSGLWICTNYTPIAVAPTVEGSWTPTLLDASQNPSEGQTYGNRTGRYTKIGKRVIIQGFITISGLGTLTTSDGALIGGLPFTSDTTPLVYGGVHVHNGNNLSITAGNALGGIINPTTNYIVLTVWDSTTGASPLLISQVTASGVLYFEGSYTTS